MRYKTKSKVIAASKATSLGNINRFFHPYRSSVHVRKYEENLLEKYFVHNVSKF